MKPVEELILQSKADKIFQAWSLSASRLWDTDIDKKMFLNNLAEKGLSEEYMDNIVDTESSYDSLNAKIKEMAKIEAETDEV